MLINSQYQEIIFKLIIAAILGGLIGIERDIRGRAAGLRTHILVAVGSALFMIISLDIYDLYQFKNATSILRIDPGRIAAQIITGIGFIGAGAIVRSGFDIRGLTTAGCIWVCAGIGMAVGIGYYLPAYATALIALITLIILNKVELLYFKDAYIKINLTLKDENFILEEVKDFLKKINIEIRYFQFKKNFIDNILSVSFTIKKKHKGKKNFYSQFLINELKSYFSDKLISIEWKDPSSK